MEGLTERQRSILLLVIRDYIETAQPVSSAHLLENYPLNYSSATIRNELAALAELGFLRQPHTSSGRVPTESGYRYFVSQTTLQAELPAPVQNTILHQFHQSRPEVEQWMTLAASVLANHSQALSVVTAPYAERNRVKHIELIATHGRQVLMVLVLYGGEVSQQFLSIAEPVGQERLTEAARVLTSTFKGHNASQIRREKKRLDVLESDISVLLMQELKRLDTRGSGQFYFDGLANMLAIQETNGTDETARALRLLDERTSLQELIQSNTSHSEPGSVSVVIGGEGEWQELRNTSLVLARYGVPGFVSGTLGVLGPMRMPYGKAIPTVRYVANILSDLFTDSNLEFQE